ncbi:MAG: chloride channel protein [Acidimicrobiia bacterium]
MTTELFARDRTFWQFMGSAAAIGFLAGAAALAFNVLVRWGQDLIWPDAISPEFGGGAWWWVAALGLTGLIVGVLRIAWHVPDDLDGSLTIIQGAKVDETTALPAIGISMISLIGGVSLGPFDGGVRSGALVGSWWARMRGLPNDQHPQSTLSGINGALGGMLTAPILATLMVTEMRWPERKQYYRILIPSLTAAIFGFAVNFAILGDTFLGVFAMPSYDVDWWHLFLGVPIGLAGATLAWVLGAVVFVIRRWIVPLIKNQIARATLGGIALGLIAMALPLTLASGKGQLGVVIDGVETISTLFLVAVVGGKIVAVAIALSTGFIGGPVMPSLFIGGVAGLALHSAIPEIPITLAFTTMLVAVPGVSIGAPFTMVLLAALTVGVGAVETVPAAVAVLTAYTATAGLGWFGLPIDKARVDIDEVTVQTELFEIGEDTTSATAGDGDGDRDN